MQIKQKAVKIKLGKDEKYKCQKGKLNNVQHSVQRCLDTSMKDLLITVFDNIKRISQKLKKKRHFHAHNDEKVLTLTTSRMS